MGLATYAVIATGKTVGIHEEATITCGQMIKAAPGYDLRAFET